MTWRADRDALYPPFRDAVEALLTRSPYHWYVLSGYRSLAEQAALWNEYRLRGGPKAAPPGSSAHNYRLAVDVVLDTDPRDGLQPSWDIRLGGWLWLKVATWLTRDLEHGSAFGDWPHIQYAGWKAHKAVAAAWYRTTHPDVA